MRQWINLFEDKNYAPVLETAWDIAEYISTMSPQYVDEEFIAEHYFGCRAVLQSLPVSAIEQGPADNNIRDEKKEAKYLKATTDIPPIVVENGIVADGNHRLRVAIAKNMAHILCYVVEEIS